MISPLEIIIRLLMGAVIGGIIGFEREVHGRAAGFRTQLIVCVAAVLIMIVSENYYYYVGGLDSTLRIDPARIAAGAIIGIGFLGGGVIIKSGSAVRGLTSAASIWIVSAIGLAVGAGMYLESVVATALTVMALVVLREVERKIKVLTFRTITVTTNPAENAEEIITSILAEYGLHISSVDYEKDNLAKEIVYNFSVSTRNKKVFKDLFVKLGELEIARKVTINSGDRMFSQP